MRHLLLLALVIAASGAAPPSRLPHGCDNFLLGMSRAQVDSAVASRGLSILSDGTAFLVCASDEPAAEYEQYSFFRDPSGANFLWKVTIGYRLDASRKDYAAVHERLEGQLGKVAVDSWTPADTSSSDLSRPKAAAHKTVWVDEFTTVQMGARWSGATDPNAARMMVSWVDRRLQRYVEARRKKDKPAS